MARWEIPLKLNHKFSNIELNRWLHLFDSPACKVTQIEDGSYYLTACRFEKLSDADEARKSARNLKTIMSAIAKIELGIDYQAIDDDDEENDISSIRERLGDECSHFMYLKPGKAQAFGLDPTVVIQDEHGNVILQPRQERWYDFFLDQCDDWIDKTVIFKALDYFAKKTEPRTLRLTYDTIREDEGNTDALLSNNWVKKPELDDFTGFLNYHDLGGQELHVKKMSKHTKKLHKKKTGLKNDYRPKMNLLEARTFLAQRLLKPWLIKKRDITSAG